MNMKTISTWLCVLSLAFFVGCNSSTDTTGGNEAGGDTTAGGDEHDHAGHDHPTHGPHDGDLIELGNEEYHAELTDDHEKGTVTIYILDSTAKKTVAIEAKEVTINLKHEGEAEQFKLAASPDEGDADGKSSRFVSSSEELAEEIEHDHGETTLVVTIKGKTFRGKVKHSHEGHDHEGHDH